MRSQVSGTASPHYLTPREFREFNEPPSFTGIGVSVSPNRHGLSVARVFDSSPAARGGLREGDLIVAVNGRKLAGVSADAAIALIKGPPGTDVKLGVQQRRDGHTRLNTLTLTRATISEPVVASQTKTVDARKLGVVALATFSPGAHGELREGVEHELHSGARGIVLDLRANGGGLVEEARLIASVFIAKGTIVSTRGRTQPSETLTAVGDAIPPRYRWWCWWTRTRPPPRRSSNRPSSAGPPSAGDRPERTRFGRENHLSGGGAAIRSGGARWTSPKSASTSRTNQPAPLGGGGVMWNTGGRGCRPRSARVRHGVDMNTEPGQLALRTLAAKVK